MTDARLDRVSRAWHDEFDRWSRVNNQELRRYEIVRGRLVGTDSIPDVIHHTVSHKRAYPRIDAEAWLNTYRNRAAARAALAAI